MREVTINNIRVKYRDQDVPVITEVFLEDSYRINEFVPKHSIVADIGAHIGLFSLRCAVERECQVFAYEAHPTSYHLMLEELKANALERRVTVSDVAVGGRNDFRQLYYTPDHLASSTLYRPSDIETLQVNVEVITLADIRLCYVLKVDCEGAEKEIFTEEFSAYIKGVGVILLEWHNYDGLRYKEFLENLGYSVTLTGCGLPVPTFDKSFARGMLYARREPIGK